MPTEEHMAADPREHGPASAFCAHFDYWAVVGRCLYVQLGEEGEEFYAVPYETLDGDAIYERVDGWNLDFAGSWTVQVTLKTTDGHPVEDVGATRYGDAYSAHDVRLIDRSEVPDLDPFEDHV